MKEKNVTRDQLITRWHEIQERQTLQETVERIKTLSMLDDLARQIEGKVLIIDEKLALCGYDSGIVEMEIVQ